MGEQPYLTALYRAVFSTAYFGLLRISEVVDTLSGHSIKVMDVHTGINKRKMMFILQTSKTHGQGDKPQIIKISSKDGAHRTTQISMQQYCPYSLLNNYLDCRTKKRTDNENFFIFSDGSKVNAYHARNLLKKILLHLQIDASLYCFQAFHTGRATDLMHMGLSIETIKKLGRSKSNAIYTYLRS